MPPPSPVPISHCATYLNFQMWKCTEYQIKKRSEVIWFHSFDLSYRWKIPSSNDDSTLGSSLYHSHHRLHRGKWWHSPASQLPQGTNISQRSRWILCKGCPGCGKGGWYCSDAELCAALRHAKQAKLWNFVTNLNFPTSHCATYLNFQQRKAAEFQMVSEKVTWL